MDLWGDKKTPEELVQKCLQRGEKLLWYRWTPAWHLLAWVIAPVMVTVLFPVIAMFLFFLFLSFFTHRFSYPWQFPLIASGAGMLVSSFIIYQLNKVNKGRIELISNYRVLQGEVSSFKLDKKNRPQVECKEISLNAIKKAELSLLTFSNKGVLSIQDNEQSIIITDIMPDKEFTKSLPVELQQKLLIKTALKNLPENDL